MRVSSVRPVVPAARPAAARAAVEPARKAPAPQQAPVKAQAGGRDGVLGLLTGLFLNGFGPLSGFLSIGNDIKELRNDPANKVAHGIEIAGDVLNIVSWPAAALGGPAAAGVLQLLGLATKTTGEMMAGKR